MNEFQSNLGNTNNFSILNFSFKEESIDNQGNSSFTDINGIKTVEDNNLKIAFNLQLTGLSFVGNHPWENTYLNFCLYESNNTSKGYQVLDLLDVNLLRIKEVYTGSYISIGSTFLEFNPKNDKATLPFIAKNKYDYENTYISLRIFGSKKKINDIEELDSNFFNINTILLDSKVPVIEVSVNE